MVYSKVDKGNSQTYKYARELSNGSSVIYIDETGNSKTKLTKRIIVK